MRDTLKYLWILLLSGAFLSCSDWLDVKPDGTVTEEELFEAREGYRNALLGVYRQMASWEMYGQEMLWGSVDVMAQLYNTRRIHTRTNYYLLATTYQYDDKLISPIFENIWSKTYNNIANCNNLIQRVEKEDASMFSDPVTEGDLIRGEALALRAFLHFDMLRLFAPAPIVAQNDQTTYIPYYENYPSLFEAHKTVKEVLDLVVRDLLKAKELVATHDTLDYRSFIKNRAARMENSGTSGKADLFFRYRGYRMNYYAICATLARVYNYMGTYDDSFYLKAYEQAQEVFDANDDPNKNAYYAFFKLTDEWDAEDDWKLYDGIIFTLSNQQLPERYLEYDNYSGENAIQFALNGTKAALFDDNSDVRSAYLTQTSGSYLLPRKYIASGSASKTAYNKDMLPMIRLSEMYHIQAEYLYRNGKTQEAIAKLDAVRGERGCTKGNLKITSWDTFVNELIKEARREFMQEGQLFYYYKRFNIKPLASMLDKDFVVPLPESEIIF